MDALEDDVLLLFVFESEKCEALLLDQRHPDSLGNEDVSNPEFGAIFKGNLQSCLLKRRIQRRNWRL